jgi:uncharacterized protein YbjT (DUF2867 family)
MKIVVFGATGQVGSLLVNEALNVGHEVVAHVRNREKITPRDKLSIVEGGLGDKEKIGEAIKGADAVISVIGPVGWQSKLIFAPGYENIISAMKKHGVRRIIALGTPTIPDLNDRFNLVFWFLIITVGFLINRGSEDLQKVGQILRNSGLDWTIVRAPLLNNKSAKGKITTGYFGNGVNWFRLSRADFVHFLLEQLNDTKFIGKAPAISN